MAKEVTVGSMSDICATHHSLPPGTTAISGMLCCQACAHAGMHVEARRKGSKFRTSYLTSSKLLHNTASLPSYPEAILNNKIFSETPASLDKKNGKPAG